MRPSPTLWPVKAGLAKARWPPRIATSAQPTSLRDATLQGLSNALEAMINDMLVAYGSAQLMIAEQFTPTAALFKSTAMRIGQDSYIYAILAVSFVILI